MTTSTTTCPYITNTTAFEQAFAEYDKDNSKSQWYPRTCVINTFDTSAVTTMEGRFLKLHQQFCNPFNQNLNDWNTNAVKTMKNMFNGAVDLNQNVSGWATGAVTSMVHVPWCPCQ